jgi:hypothetical protein
LNNEDIFRRVHGGDQGHRRGISVIGAAARRTETNRTEPKRSELIGPILRLLKPQDDRFDDLVPDDRFLLFVILKHDLILPDSHLKSNLI